jgi:hypothetical protein
MSPNPFQMMMMSGVLRRNTVERRFDRGQTQHHSTGDMRGFLTSLWGLPHDAIQKPSVELHRLQSRTPDLRSPVSAGVWQFSLKKSLASLFAPFNGVGDMRNRGLEQPHASQQTERIRTLESLLKAERERIRQLSRELLSARATLKQLSEVQAELDVERETGRQLVQFLEAAERESAKLRARNK